GGDDGLDTLGGKACAKNVLTVGAVRDIEGGYTDPFDVYGTDFTGWGPTDDGRIKPDIMANGHELYSCDRTDNAAYATKSGTSMSAPNLAGSLALLIQHYRATHASTDMLAATLKAIVIHSADESFYGPGPVYWWGWGLFNAQSAADLISLDETYPAVIQELTLTQGQTLDQPMTYNGSGPIRVTACWTDPPGTPPPPSLDPPDLMLVNDLDLRVIGPDLTQHEPYVQDPADPIQLPTRGDNFRDNVEMVDIEDPSPGVYTIRVTHKGTLTDALQDFSLAQTGLTPVPSPTGACCFENEPGHPCSDLTEEACNTGSGYYHGDGTTCGPRGACCFKDGSCAELAETCCARMNGKM
ncbi:MAG: S8 family serine peptidase, partial [bacterium]|nr:S8 family serine peptidase [bacterium]